MLAFLMSCSPSSTPDISGKASESNGKDGEVVQTFEDQGAVQHPNVAKAPLFSFGFEKHTTRPIDENVDSIMGLKCAQVSEWMLLEHRREYGLVCRETGIEVRVLLKGDARMILVTAKVPQNFRKGWLDTKHLWRVNQTIEYNEADESTLTAHDDSFRVMKGRQWRMEEYELNHHLWSPFVLGILEKKGDEGPTGKAQLLYVSLTV